MKNFIHTTILLAMTAITASAQTEKADTLVHASDIDKLTITEGADGLRVELRGNKADSTYTYQLHETYPEGTKVKSSKQVRTKSDAPTLIDLSKKDGDSKWRQRISLGLGVNLGFVAGLGTPSSLKLNTWESAEVSWLDMISYNTKKRKGKDTFSLGLGLTWRNYRMTDGNKFVVNDGMTSIKPFDEGLEYDYSHLMVFSLSMPILWKHDFSKNFGIKLGPIVNFNTHSQLFNSYTLDNREVEEMHTDIQLTPVTVDAFCAIKFCPALALYCRYSPCNVLKHSSDPTIKPLSIGLQIGF